MAQGGTVTRLVLVDVGSIGSIKSGFFDRIAHDTFDSEPQVAGVSKDDVGLTLSIGWTF